MFSRNRGQTGRRFVTEATLIYSSWRSDSVNVSRDVTFPQHLKRLLRALILSCLIVCWISYDKQTRVVVGGELGMGGGGLWMGIHSSARQCFAAGSRCFCKWPLCLLQRGFKSPELRSGFSLQTSRIAGLLQWIWLISSKLFHPLPMSLVCLLAPEISYPPGDRHWTDGAGLLWTIKRVRCSSSTSTGQSRYTYHHRSSGSQIYTSSNK